MESNVSVWKVVVRVAYCRNNVTVSKITIKLGKQQQQQNFSCSDQAVYLQYIYMSCITDICSRDSYLASQNT